MRFSYLILTVIMSISLLQAQNNQLQITPYPQQVEYTGEAFTFSSSSRIVLGEGSGDAERFLADLLAGEIYERFNVKPDIVTGDDQKETHDIFLGLIGHSDIADEISQDYFTPQMEDERYYFRANKDGIVITAKTSRGLYYGGMSLLQSIELKNKELTVPGVKIQDYPAFKFRGISDDISRGQVSTLENFKEIIRRLARYKQNVYMPYLEDMFRFESHPHIGKNRGALSREQVEELDAFARKHHVEIIPIFQTLGHMENMLLLPEYVGYAEFPGAASLNVSDERIYDLLQDFFDEIVPAFSSKYFHMAADESWDVGRGASRELVEQTSIADVHARHFIRVYNMLRDMGKEVIMYADIATGLGEAIPGYPEVLDQLPDDIIMVFWDYWLQRSYADKANILADAGQPFMVSPGVWNWHPIYPDNVTAPVNIRNMAHTGVETGAVGFINSSWGDYGGETLRELNWFGFAYGAEVSWSPDYDSVEKFSRHFLRDFYGTDDNRLRIIYSLLANIGNKITNLALWQPPFMPPAGTTSWNLTPQFMVHYNQINEQVSLLHTLIDEVADDGIVSRNINHIDYLRFSVQRAELFVNKIDSAKYLSGFKDAGSMSDDEITKGIALCDSMIDEVKQLQQSFEQLWRRTNIEANLDNLITHYYQRQISYWKEKKEELQNNIYWTDQVSPGKFIYHPEATPYVSRGTRKPHVYFRKSFTIENLDEIEKMMVQTVGDTYLRIYINGKEVGESYAKRALSLIVQMARTRFWNVTDHLAEDENVIAIEARNYLHAGSGGVNWFSELFMKDGTKRGIHSDDTWKVAETVPDDWYKPDYNDGDWLDARIVEERVPLIDRPNFEHNRKSWIIDRVWTATLED